MQGPQPLAAWLVQKPYHAVLGLALTLLLPFAQILTGAAMTVIVLALGLGKALSLGAMAAAVVGVMSVITGADVVTILANAALFWLPAALVAGLLRRTRSLPLTLQVTAIVALAGTLLTHIVLADPVAFWKAQLAAMSVAFMKMGFEQQANLLLAQQDILAPQMTVLFVLTTWSLIALVLALGYWVFQSLPEQAARFGRFCDLNFGRILAIVTIVAAVLAVVSGVNWLQNLALVGFAMFWVQGLALLHWLRVEGPLPFVALIVVYGLLPVLNVLLMAGLAALGYSDAWLNYRARARRNP
ncbi:MAG: hypothetical protein AAGA61_03145 [Pseudomonadota bacterium]